MRDPMRAFLQPSGPTPTIGAQNVRLRKMPVHRRIDFYDTAGRLHGLIVLVPLLYGAIQVYREQALSGWFWSLAIATTAFAIFARRAPYLRLSPGGISFPEKGPREYPWDQMLEARAREEQLDIVLADGLNLVISYRKMRRRDIDRLKRVMREQFKAMAERARQADSELAQAA